MAKVLKQVCQSLVDVLNVINEDEPDEELAELIELNKNDVWGLIQLLENETGMSTDDVLEQVITILEVM